MFNAPVFTAEAIAEALQIIRGEFLFALWETLYVTLLSTLFALILGLPLGVLLVAGEKDGILPLPTWFMKLLGTLINVLRSVPFLLLMMLVFPLTRLIVGTAVGTTASIVPLVASWERMLAFVAGHRELVEHYLAFRREAISEVGMQRLLLSHIASHLGELEAVVPEELVWHRDVFREELNVNVVRKIMRMRKIERSKREMPVEDVFDNVETAFMSALYMYYRALYNDAALSSACPSLGTALFVFIRNYAYSGMFRYNRSGEFNVPYGGIAYNHKSLRKKLDYYRQESLLRHFANTTLCNLDFEEFFQRHTPEADDFVFLDPPYDSEFSTYAKNEFTQRDQERLASYLLHGCAAKWMLVIKNTDFIRSLYEHQGLTIRSFSKTYLVSFMNRNDRSAEHLMITNY